MGISGGDAGCRARNYVKWDNERLNVTAVKHSDSRSAVLRYQVSPPLHFEERG